MACVLIVHPPTSIARDFIDYPWFGDLGAAQTAAVARRLGHDVALVDAHALPGSTLAWRADGRAHLGAPVEEVVEACGEHLRTSDVVVVAYTPFHRPPARCDVLGATLAAIRAKTPGAYVLLADLYQSGQHYVEAEGECVLSSYREADAWLKYEAEGALASVLAQRPRGAVRGVDVASLDELPEPAWDLVDLGAHDAFRARVVTGLGRAEWAFPIDGRTLPLVTSRGCPFRCAHCSSNPGRVAGAPKTQRRLSPEVLRARVHELARRHGATRLHVLDEMVNVSARHFEALLDAVEQEGLRFDVPNGMRADYLERDHLRRMHGRVTTLSVSAESGVQRVIDEVVGKQLDLSAVVRAAEGAHAEGVPAMIHFIVGMPGETPEEIEATLGFAEDLHARFGTKPAVQFATPLPGTRLAEGRMLPVVEDWGPRFQATPSQPGALVTPEALLASKQAFESRLQDRSAPPRTLSVVTNFRCNQACVWCTRRSAEDDPRFIHPAAVRTRIDRGLATGSEEVELTGGEPGMRRDLEDLVRHARARGARRVVLETNATLFDDARAARLREAGLDLARVNVPAPGDACDAMTRDPGGFERAVAGMKALANAGIGVEACVTLVRSAAPHLASLPAPLHAALGSALRAIVVGFPVEAAGDRECLSFDEAASAVHAVERSARPLGIALRMKRDDALPPCAFDAAARPADSYAGWKRAPRLAGHSHVDTCSRCTLLDRCPGLPDAYRARFGIPQMHPLVDG